MTAQDGIESKLHGFDIGADDYICKPFNHQELVARVHAVMRRVKNNGKAGIANIRCGQIELFPGELKVLMPDHAPIALTPTEMYVLRVLMPSPSPLLARTHFLLQLST